jgi:hypothetical protein
MQQVAQERYPALSAVDALVALHRDFALLLRPIAKATPEIMKLFGICTGNPRVILRGEAAGILKAIFPQIEEGYKTLFGPARTVSSNSTGEGDAISAQLTAQILERFKSGSLGSLSPVANGIGAAKAAATATAGTGLAAGNAQGATGNAAGVAQNARSTGASFLQGLSYNQCVQTALASIQAIQGYQAVQALNAIADHLEDSNAITVSGSGGPNGFAQHVYNFINGKTLDIVEAERNKHRFFVFNPDTIWYPAFGELVRENPLPPQFVDKGQKLDHMCLFMREVRTKLNEAEPEHGKDVTFHLLMPSWQQLAFKMPLHFPEDLYPLRIEGLTNSGGKEMVRMNLPCAPSDLLDDVANDLDAKGWNKLAGIAREIIGFEFVALYEEGPRVLGSSRRLDLRPEITWEEMQWRIERYKQAYKSQTGKK